MFDKKEVNFNGLNRQEESEFLAWLNHDEAKYLWRVLDTFASNADRGALQPPSDKVDWNKYTAEQQRQIGQGIAYRRVAEMKRALSED